MAERSRQAGYSSNLEDTVSYTDNDLQVALDDFLDEENRKGVKPSLLNFQTVMGFVIIFLTMSFLIQYIGLNIGPNLSGIVKALPLIGGILVTFVGLGVFNRDRRKRRKESKRQAKRERKRNSHLYNSLDERDRRKKRRRRRDFDDFYSKAERNIKMDPYALRQNKKLYRSRRDKKIFGVCGGLAKYFGASSTFIRLMFAIITLLGYGFPIILYFILAVVLPKEPYSLFDDDFNFKK